MQPLITQQTVRNDFLWCSEIESELIERVRAAVLLPVRIDIKDVYDETCTELRVTAALDSGGRGRPRVTYDVTAALNAMGACLHLPLKLPVILRVLLPRCRAVASGAVILAVKNADIKTDRAPEIRKGAASPSTETPLVDRPLALLLRCVLSGVVILERGYQCRHQVGRASARDKKRGCLAIDLRVAEVCSNGCRAVRVHGGCVSGGAQRRWGPAAARAPPIPGARPRRPPPRKHC